MTKESFLIMLGVATALIPFSGFPSSWKSAATVLAGMCITATAFVVRSRVRAAHHGTNKEDAASAESVASRQPRRVSTNDDKTTKA